MTFTRREFHHAAIAALGALLLAPAAPVAAAETTLLNVSYDPTRELYDDYNKAFAKYWEAKSGQKVTIRQSHGGSGKQARTVIDASPRTWSLWPRRRYRRARDTRQAAAHQLAGPPAAQQRALYLDHRVSWCARATPRASGTGRPRQARRQGDHANPKTSGGARWNYLAGWAWALKQAGGSEATATEYVRKLFQNVPVLDTGARGSLTTFAQRGIGDVFISWENEAFLAVKEIGADRFEIVVPPSASLQNRRSPWWTRWRCAGAPRTWHAPTWSTSTPRKARRSSRSTTTGHATRRSPRSTPACSETEPRDHRGLRRLGGRAEEALRRRRRFRQDLRTLIGQLAPGDPRTGRRRAPVAS